MCVHVRPGASLTVFADALAVTAAVPVADASPLTAARTASTRRRASRRMPTYRSGAAVHLRVA
jgi:hypothetical protein